MALYSPIEDAIRDFLQNISGDEPEPENREELIANLADLLKRHLGIAEYDIILGEGAFGRAVSLPDGRVLKLTTDPEEVQASHVIQASGREFTNVIQIHGAWQTGFKTYHIDLGKDLPIGFLIMEELPTVGTADPDDAKGLSAIVRSVKDKFEVWGNQLAKMKHLTQRTYLKKASLALADRLEREGIVEGRTALYEISNGLRELHSIGIYATDVHPGNVGFDENMVHKIFDIGLSSAPRRKKPKALGNPGQEAPMLGDSDARWPLMPITSTSTFGPAPMLE